MDQQGKGRLVGQREGPCVELDWGEGSVLDTTSIGDAPGLGVTEVLGHVF